MPRNALHEAIWKIVGTIPQGRVASYGQVARLAGWPKHARLVGAALGKAPAGRLPWHRVINSQGRIALPPNSPAYREQCKRLRAEGVMVVNGRVNLRQYGWKAGDESPLLN